MNERALTLNCCGEQLLAILHSPEPDNDRGIGVVIVVGGAQYRVGSHRMFVILARSLAAAGCTVLRFDRRGMGDSSGDDPGFDDCNEDIQTAVAGLREGAPDLGAIYLMGLCDGATAAAICHFSDDAISGYLLINPWIRSPQTEARVLVGHYYKKRLSDRTFWRELFAGKIQLRQSLREYVYYWRNTRANRLVLPSLQTELFYRLQRANKPALFALSEKDITGQEFLAVSKLSPWQDWVEKDPRIELVSFEGADHTFSSPSSLDSLVQLCRDWLTRPRET